MPAEPSRQVSSVNTRPLGARDVDTPSGEHATPLELTILELQALTGGKPRAAELVADGRSQLPAGSTAEPAQRQGTPEQYPPTPCNSDGGGLRALRWSALGSSAGTLPSSGGSTLRSNVTLSSSSPQLSTHMTASRDLHCSAGSYAAPAMAPATSPAANPPSRLRVTDGAARVSRASHTASTHSEFDSINRVAVVAGQEYQAKRSSRPRKHRSRLPSSAPVAVPNAGWFEEEIDTSAWANCRTLTALEVQQAQLAALAAAQHPSTLPALKTVAPLVALPKVSGEARVVEWLAGVEAPHSAETGAAGQQRPEPVVTASWQTAAQLPPLHERNSIDSTAQRPSVDLLCSFPAVPTTVQTAVQTAVPLAHCTHAVSLTAHLPASQQQAHAMVSPFAQHATNDHRETRSHDPGCNPLTALCRLLRRQLQLQ